MPNSIGEARSKSGLSQTKFAQALQISPRTLQEWEQGRRSPSGSARALINIAIRHPEIIKESYEELLQRQNRSSALLESMTTHLISGNEIEFSDLILDWYREEHTCSLVPKPQDQDPIRLAVKASIIEHLCEVLNSPPHNGNQAPANWCQNVSGLEEPLYLQSERLLEDEDLCQAFEKRNLYAVRNFMFFI